MTDEASLADEAHVLQAWEQGTLRELIERDLRVLIGETFRCVGRAADLVWVGFGPDEPAADEREPGRLVAGYALHVQCPFRLDVEGRPWLGSSDVYVQPESPGDTPDDFEWDVQGSNLFDVRAAELNVRLGRIQPTVEKIAADSCGGLKILMTDDLRLQLLPATSYRCESWRFFRPGGGPHFVVLSETD